MDTETKTNLRRALLQQLNNVHPGNAKLEELHKGSRFVMASLTELQVRDELSEMQGTGLIDSRASAVLESRRLYTITPKGRDALRELAD